MHLHASGIHNELANKPSRIRIPARVEYEVSEQVSEPRLLNPAPSLHFQSTAIHLSPVRQSPAVHPPQCSSERYIPTLTIPVSQRSSQSPTSTTSRLPSLPLKWAPPTKPPHSSPPSPSAKSPPSPPPTTKPTSSNQTPSRNTLLKAVPPQTSYWVVRPFSERRSGNGSASRRMKSWRP